MSKTLPQLIASWIAGVQPPIPVEHLAARLGIHIADDPFDEKPVLAGMLVHEPDQALIVVNTRHAHPRQRFTIAHEIGHFLFDTFKPVWVCQAVGPTQSLHFCQQSAPAYAREERQANRFAAALLMPANAIREDFHDFTAQGRDWEDDDTISQLAQRYAVSTQALLIRLMALRLLG